MPIVTPIKSVCPETEHVIAAKRAERNRVQYIFPNGLSLKRELDSELPSVKIRFVMVLSHRINS